jgi:hypothetical protein
MVGSEPIDWATKMMSEDRQAFEHGIRNGLGAVNLHPDQRTVPQTAQVTYGARSVQRHGE